MQQIANCRPLPGSECISDLGKGTVLLQPTGLRSSQKHTITKLKNWLRMVVNGVQTSNSCQKEVTSAFSIACHGIERNEMTFDFCDIELKIECVNHVSALQHSNLASILACHGGHGRSLQALSKRRGWRQARLLA